MVGMGFHGLTGCSTFSFFGSWSLLLQPPSRRVLGPQHSIRHVFRWAASLASILPIAVISCCSESQACKVASGVGQVTALESRFSTTFHIILLLSVSLSAWPPAGFAVSIICVLQVPCALPQASRVSERCDMLTATIG